MIPSWGKCTIWIAKLVNGTPSTWKKIYTPVDGSTQLQTTKGEKKEAKIEGGDNEAVKYNKSTYALVFNIRGGNEDGTPREKPFDDNDGVIEGEYALKLQPEDASVEGLNLERGTLSCEDQWSSADGTIWAYTFDALKPASGDTVKWDVITDPTTAGGGS